MLKAMDLSLIKINLHEQIVPEFLKEITKIPYFQIRDLKQSNIGEFYRKILQQRSLLSKDMDMINHKMSSIEEHLLYIFNKLKIDPDSIPKPPKEKRYYLKVKNLEELIDHLHEQTENESRRLKEYYSRIDQGKEEIEFVKLFLKILDWLATFGINEQKLNYLHQYNFEVAYIHEEEFENFMIGLEQDQIPRIIQYKKIDEKFIGFFIIYHKSHEEHIQELLTTFRGRDIENIRDYITEDGIDKGELEKELQEYERRIENANKLIDSLKTEQQILKYRAFLEILENIRIYIKLEQMFYKNPYKKIVSIEAYVPRIYQDEICNKLVEKFKEKIKIIAKPIERTPIYTGTGEEAEEEGQTKKPSSLFSEISIEESADIIKKTRSSYINEKTPIKSSELKDLPTIVQTPKIFRPFRRLVGLYGTANYGEIDPTPFFAITFSFLFGLMFGDVGHGLVFLLIGILMVSVKKFQKKESYRDYGMIFIWLGSFAIVGGLLYGEMFGKEIEINGEKIALLANPMENVIVVLKFAIILGIIHLSLGWLINAINYAINKRKYLAFVDPIMKIVLLACGSYLIFTWKFDIYAWISPPYPILYAVIPGLILLLGKPIGKLIGISYLQHEKFLKLFGEATMEVEETYQSIVSNVASYSRILALSMAHIGLMTMVEIIADLIPSLKWVIVILGNIFVIFLEGLLAAIHSLRLEFYEFFGKFFIADGIEYKPTTVKNDYSMVEFQSAP